MGNIEEQARKDFSGENYPFSGKACEEKKGDTQKALDDLYLVTHTLGDRISDLQAKLEPAMLPNDTCQGPEVIETGKVEPASSLVRQITECSVLLRNVDYAIEDILKRLQV